MASRAHSLELWLLIALGGFAAAAHVAEARRIALVIDHATYGAVDRPGDVFTGDAGAPGGVTFAQFAIEVEGDNAPPRIARPSLFALEAVPLRIELPVDPDGDPLTIRVDEVPEVGTLRAGPRTIGRGDTLSLDELAALVVEPDANRIVGDFAYTASDPEGASAATAIRFTVGTAGGAAAPALPAATAAGDDGPALEGDSFEPFRVVQTANVRGGPDADSERITTLRAGTVLKVFEQAQDSGWLEVETLDGRRGYVYGELIEAVPASEVPDLDPGLRPPD